LTNVTSRNIDRQQSAESPTPMNESLLRVALVDQHRVFVDALVYCLKTEPGIEVVGSADGTEDELAPLYERRPNLVILDADLPLGRAFDIAAEIRRRLEPVRILFLARGVADPLIVQALRVRADGILSRDEPLSQLVHAIRRSHRGEPTFSQAIEERLDFDPVRREFHLRVDQPMKSLTDKQLEILRHLARGETVKAIARKLFLSPKSVDNLKFRMMNKIGVRDKVALALYCVREGLIEP
jgi:DNA-binding NarL/FixJ family response regulator